MNREIERDRALLFPPFAIINDREDASKWILWRGVGTGMCDESSRNLTVSVAVSLEESRDRASWSATNKSRIIQ